MINIEAIKQTLSTAANWLIRPLQSRRHQALLHASLIGSVWPQLNKKMSYRGHSVHAACAVSHKP